jgi:hypothetical protein
MFCFLSNAIQMNDNIVFRPVDDVQRLSLPEKVLYLYRRVDAATLAGDNPAHSVLQLDPSNPHRSEANSDCTLGSVRICGGTLKCQGARARHGQSWLVKKPKTLPPLKHCTRCSALPFLRKDQSHRAVCVVETLDWVRWPWSLAQRLVGHIGARIGMY